MLSFLTGILSGYHGYAAPAIAHAAYGPALAPSYGAYGGAYGRPAVLARPAVAAVPAGLLGKNLNTISN